MTDRQRHAREPVTPCTCKSRSVLTNSSVQTVVTRDRACPLHGGRRP